MIHNNQSLLGFLLLKLTGNANVMRCNYRYNVIICKSKKEAYEWINLSLQQGLQIKFIPSRLWGTTLRSWYGCKHEGNVRARLHDLDRAKSKAFFTLHKAKLHQSQVDSCGLNSSSKCFIIKLYLQIYDSSRASPALGSRELTSAAVATQP